MYGSTASTNSRLTQESGPTDRYWAQEPPEELAACLIARREAFFEFMETSHFFARIYRIWRMYHGLYFDGDGGDMEIQMAGEDGEYQMMSVNHLRALLHLVVTYATQNRPAWDPIAINSDHESMEQADAVAGILDDTMERKRLESIFRRAAEHALILSAGYVRSTWDWTQGVAIGQDQMSGSLVREGDVDYCNPSIFDVIYDFSRQEWRKNQWVFWREPTNKWDLIAEHPEWTEEILAACQTNKDAKGHSINSVYLSGGPNRDLVDKWYFCHLPCPSVPKGRYFCLVGDKAYLADGDYEREMLPISRVTAGEFLLTSFGYTNAFDLAGLQEALNAEFSTIVTNHNNLAQQKVWSKSGDTISMADLDNGTLLLQSEEKPEPLNLLSTPAEVFKAIEVFVQHLEYVSGVNSVARGQPEASLKSGTALALVDQKALQFSSTFAANVMDLHADVGTMTIWLYQENVQSPRVYRTIGVLGQTQLKSFTKDAIKRILRVRVKSGNPLAKTLAGRAQIAEDLLAKGLVKTPEEYFTVLETGQLKPLTRATTSQLKVIHEENQALLQGQPVDAWNTDNHVLHIQEHQAICDSMELRSDPTRKAFIMTHIIQHVELMSDPLSAQLQVVLGYPNPLAMAQPAAMPGATDGPPPQGESKLPMPPDMGASPNELGAEETRTQAEEAARNAKQQSAA